MSVQMCKVWQCDGVQCSHRADMPPNSATPPNAWWVLSTGSDFVAVLCPDCVTKLGIYAALQEVPKHLG